MARPAVIFGGPSPEHDISILSGLQAARSLHDAGREPVALYWAKNGDLHAVPAMLEAIAQLGAYAVLSDDRFAGKLPLFGGVEKARFRRQVLPGDTLESLAARMHSTEHRLLVDVLHRLCTTPLTHGASA